MEEGGGLSDNRLTHTHTHLLTRSLAPTEPTNEEEQFQVQEPSEPPWNRLPKLDRTDMCPPPQPAQLGIVGKICQGLFECELEIKYFSVF